MIRFSFLFLVPVSWPKKEHGELRLGLLIQPWFPHNTCKTDIVFGQTFVSLVITLIHRSCHVQHLELPGGLSVMTARSVKSMPEISGTTCWDIKFLF